MDDDKFLRKLLQNDFLHSSGLYDPNPKTSPKPPKSLKPGSTFQNPLYQNLGYTHFKVLTPIFTLGSYSPIQTKNREKQEKRNKNHISVISIILSIL
jgi:hypothetical protein